MKNISISRIEVNTDGLGRKVVKLTEVYYGSDFDDIFTSLAEDDDNADYVDDSEYGEYETTFEVSKELMFKYFDVVKEKYGIEKDIKLDALDTNNNYYYEVVIR